MKVVGNDAYEDMALVLAWPMQTAFGDEAWMRCLKKLGIIKNLHFRIGHAAIILVNRASGALKYYDFGRYLCPRGTGRARSAGSDPRLTLYQKARFGHMGELLNLKDLLAELTAIDMATHGGGPLYVSILTGFSYEKGGMMADLQVKKGPVKYGALAPANNSCSRFVAKILTRACRPGHPASRRILLPELGKPSPLSNVVNASATGEVFCYENDELHPLTLSRFRSLKLQLDWLCENTSTAKSMRLPSDQQTGMLDEPLRPSHLPSSAQWLGGIGEGAWFTLMQQHADNYTVCRYSSTGLLDYKIDGSADFPIRQDEPFNFTYDSHYGEHVIRQAGRLIRLHSRHQQMDDTKNAISTTPI